MKSKKKINVCLLISLILSGLYCIYIFTTMFSSFADAPSDAAQVGVGIAVALVMPHLICALIGMIFNALAVFVRKPAFALVGAILYSVSIVLFPIYFMFVLIQMILSYVGYAQLSSAKKKLEKKSHD